MGVLVHTELKSWGHRGKCNGEELQKVPFKKAKHSSIVPLESQEIFSELQMLEQQKILDVWKCFINMIKI